MARTLTQRLVAEFQWVDPGPESTHLVSDISGWWRDPHLLAELGPALAAPFQAARPTVVISPAVTGLLLGSLAATALHVGFTPAHKPGDRRIPSPTTWAASPPDYRGRSVRLGVLDRHLGPGDRVLVVDDWVATGAQVRALYHICAKRGAKPVGSAAIVAACPATVTNELGLHALLQASQLHP